MISVAVSLPVFSGIMQTGRMYKMHSVPLWAKDAQRKANAMHSRRNNIQKLRHSAPSRCNSVKGETKHLIHDEKSCLEEVAFKMNSELKEWLWISRIS